MESEIIVSIITPLVIFSIFVISYITYKKD